MKRIIKFILPWMVFSLLLLSACGLSSSANGAAPNADRLVEFDEQGVAVLRGNVSSGSSTLGKDEIIYIAIPAKMDGMEVAIQVPFTVRPDTIIASSTVKQTDVLEFLSFHKGSSAYNAFPISAEVDVTFRKNADRFVAISMIEVTKKSLFNSKPSVAPVFSMNGVSRGTLQGHITQSYHQQDGTMLWLVSVPLPIQGVQAGVVVPVYSAADTDVVSTGGNIVMIENVGGDVVIEFTRNRNTLTAKKVTEIQ